MTHPALRSALRRALAAMTAALLGAALLTAVGVPAGAGAADVYDSMRARYAADLAGVVPGADDVGDLDAATARVASAGESAWRSLRPTTSASTEPWADLSTGTSSRHLLFAYQRVVAMATAVRTPGSALSDDPDLLADTISVAEWLNAYRYNTTRAKDAEWWYWEIGIPMEVNDLTSLLFDDLTADQRSRYLAAVARFTPHPSRTGANLAWSSWVVALRGVLAKEPAKIDEAMSGLRPALLDTTSGDGFHPDGSFVQHDRFAYTGGYGLSMLDTVSRLYLLVDGSPWERTDAAYLSYYDRIESSYAPVMWCGDLLADVRGREIARAGSTDGSAGAIAQASALRLADTAPSAARAVIRARAKQWLECSDGTASSVEAIGARADVVRARLLLADASVAPATPGAGGAVALDGMDRFVSSNARAAFSVSMSSSRIGGFESINGENLRGWYTGDGMTSLRLGTGGQFDGGYWATVNPYRMPGTTEDTMRRASAEGSSYVSPESFAGSLATPDRATGIAAMRYDAYRNNLTAKKTWFAFDDEIVCVGVDIRSSGMSGYGWDGATTRVETVIDNRLARTSDAALVVDGASIARDTSANRTATWAAVTGPGESVGYYFPRRTSVTALDETRSGSWAAINSLSGSSATVTGRYLTLVTSHGRNPAGAGYEYVLLPGATAAETASYAQRPGIQILDRSAGHVAVHDTSSATTGAVSFDATTDHTLAPDGVPLATWRGSGILSITESADAVSVSVADPARSAGRIDVTLDRAVITPELGHGLVAAEPGADGTRLEFDPTGADGRTLSVVLAKAPAPTLVRIDDADARIRYQGLWKTTSAPQDYAGGISYSSESLASFSLTFTGTRVRIETRLTSTSGINEVTIDGVVVGRYDGYAATPTYRQTVFTSSVLPDGQHTVTVTRTGTKSAAATSRNITLDGIVIETDPSG
ncbi:polysaccharide lyase family 8 super-sandwich domain-containing protein [Microbacterium sp. AZCO]|uniref:polysaccharide lyase family 8 super-sandwich domain-containing protein n=1 Tax=Microbacterium sp. AZCO TaxID=3142976 RepID=UPI0031F3A475